MGAALSLSVRDCNIIHIRLVISICTKDLFQAYQLTSLQPIYTVIRSHTQSYIVLRGVLHIMLKLDLNALFIVYFNRLLHL